MSSTRQILKPSVQHPITIEPLGRPVTVTFNGEVIARSDHALELREANYRPAIYIPRTDVRMQALERSEHTTYCPFKGDANYFSVPVAAEKGRNAVWTYETPYEAVARIRELLAFYTDRFDVTY